MTENAKRNLCRNILWKCCDGDKELEQLYRSFSKSFIKYHFQEFYEKFKHLKENPEFSKEDILRAFSDVTRGDIDFGKISQNIDKMYMSDEEIQMLQIENEYGLANINDEVELKKRLEKIVSDGINYGTNKEDVEGMKRFANIKKIMPQFEMFKETYLQLRIMGLEEQLYVGMDFENISYDKILERATSILEENTKAEEQEKGVEQPTEETTPKTDEILENDMRINECGEIIRENVTRENVIPDFVVTEELTQGKASKQLEQLQQENLTINLWNKRFQNWYSAIDRVSQNSKGKFVKMKSDIIKAIGEKLKERTHEKEIHDEQEK